MKNVTRLTRIDEARSKRNNLVIDERNVSDGIVNVDTILVMPELVSIFMISIIDYSGLTIF